MFTFVIELFSSSLYKLQDIFSCRCERGCLLIIDGFSDHYIPLENLHYFKRRIPFTSDLKIYIFSNLEDGTIIYAASAKSDLFHLVYFKNFDVSFRDILRSYDLVFINDSKFYSNVFKKMFFK